MDRKKKDIKMMNTPDDWPAWPFLPLKRYIESHKSPECAILLAGHGPKVVKCNMWSYDPKAETIEYTSFQELVDAGWIID